MLPAFIVVSILFLFFVFSGDREYKRDLSVSRANSYIQGLKIVNKKNGVDMWVMNARKADFTKDETQARMDSVSMDFTKEGAVVNADSGIYNLNSKDLLLEKNVTIQTKDSIIHAKSLAWNASQGTLTTDSRILMEGTKCTIEGDGLAATEDNKVTLMRNVKATFF
ncbi:MAG TPA: LPS export ABC transporter periplasmic protein LptC [Thermodesulfovibrionales bacterium]|nr:LPS export ABC transporter periplasmic protein LptC [Thermodesulfovibrionales bacterium]